MVTIIERERTKNGVRLGSGIFLLFSGVDHDIEGRMVNFEGAFNSLFSAQMSVRLPHNDWIKSCEGRYTINGGVGHINWAYSIVECKIGDICDFGVGYEQLFGEN